MVGQHSRLFAERRLPILFQRAGHQPVLRLDAGVTATGLVDLMLRPFEALTPMLVERFALRLQIESRRQAGLDRRRLQRLQDQPRDLASTGAAFSVWQDGASKDVRAPMHW